MSSGFLQTSDGTRTGEGEGKGGIRQWTCRHLPGRLRGPNPRVASRTGTVFVEGTSASTLCRIIRDPPTIGETPCPRSDHFN